jgi:transposase
LELERRRIRAIEAVKEGESPETVARIFGVNRCSVYRWLRSAAKPGGLAAIPHTGPVPRLSAKQCRQLESLLLKGAKVHGWATDLWTCARIVEMIRRHFSATFHHDHVGRILRERLGWTAQKPQRVAKERSKGAIKYFKRVRFPRLVREARERNAHLVFLDESGFMLTPTVRRTWAPEGKTPPLICPDRRDRLSSISSITISPKTSRMNLYFQLYSHNVHGEDVVDYLRELKRTLGGPFTVLWDRGSVHQKSKVVRQYLAKHPEIVAEDLPAYAPDLNPDELVWSWTKYGRLANLAANDKDELAENVIDELYYLKQHPELLASFVGRTQLPLAA